MWKIINITLVGVIFFLSIWVLVQTDEQTSLSTEYVELSFRELDNWSKDHQSLALVSFQKSCNVFLSRPVTAPIRPEKIGGTVADWQSVCLIAKDLGAISDSDARQFFEQNFKLLSYAEDNEGLFTGYFAPEYSGSPTPNEIYSYPLYALPNDLKIIDLGKFSSTLKGKSIIGEIKNGEFVPYKDRKIIDNGALSQQDLELVWLKNPTDAFFMHIQGSGVIRYENGDRELFGYAGKNGKAYHAIGKFLIQSGEIASEDMSMQAIRAWIKENPIQGKALMWKNPSYVFFRSLMKQSPVGSMNVELTAGRSLAVDREYVPLGMPVWLDLSPSRESADPIQRLVIAQDTGGAIKGRVRADVYWGIGDDAGLMAGPMKDKGRFYFLVPNRLAEKILNTQGAAYD